MTSDTHLPAQQRFHRLRDRLAGRPIDEVLHEGVPEHLLGPLQEWVEETLVYAPGLASRVLLNLRMAAHQVEYGDKYVFTASMQTGNALLEVADTICQLHPYTEWPNPGSLKAPDFMWRLGELLSDAGSFLRVDPQLCSLVRRVTPAADLAFNQARADASGTTARHLNAAWVCAYGMHPDPDKSFAESVKAVENLINPLVLPKDKKPSLGKAMGDLRKGAWELQVGLPPDREKNLERFIGMLSLFWDTQDSRHAGGEKARSQTQQEAEAAVHLAVTIAQWVHAGLLKK